MEILTVCTGNICRSPLAEVVLRARLGDLDVRVGSAGVQGLPAQPMTDEAVRLAVSAGARADDARAHRSRYLSARLLDSPDLILTMTRQQRRDTAQRGPRRLRSLFTVREFARLAATVSDERMRTAADVAGADGSARLRAAAALIAQQRGLHPLPSTDGDDDVQDPYGRPWRVYEASAEQLLPALDEVARVVRVVASSATQGQRGQSLP